MPVFRRLLDSLFSPAAQDSAARRVESYPPLARPWRESWPATGLLTSRNRSDVLAAARLEFAEALNDVRTPAAIDAQGRIALARSLHELWHFREEVFSLVACRHDQAEAARRLANLNRHFPRRILGLAPAPLQARARRAG